MPTLKEKALKAAIYQMNLAPTRERANLVFKTWEVFKNHPGFKAAIKEKQLKFQKRDQGKKNNYQE